MWDNKGLDEGPAQETMAQAIASALTQAHQRGVRDGIERAAVISDARAKESRERGYPEAEVACQMLASAIRASASQEGK